MTTSGTLNQTTFDAAKIIEHALRLCTLSPAGVGAEVLQTAEESLFIFLTTLQTKGVHLWCLDRQFVGLELGATSYPLIAGTHDVKEVWLRRPVVVDGTSTGSTDMITLELDTAAAAQMLGVLAAVSGEYELLIERSTDGVIWETVETVTLQLTEDVHAWHQVRTAVEALYYRVTDVTHAGTLAGELLAVTSWSDRELTRESRDRFAGNYRPFSVAPGAYWIDRGASLTTLWLDRAPNDPTDLLWVWARRNVQDVGDLYNTLDIPNQWFAATISNTAKRLAMQLPEGAVPPARLQFIMATAEQDLMAAEDEEYDESAVEFSLDLGAYTR